MNATRTDVLNQLANGQITVTEAAERLNAPAPVLPAAPAPIAAPAPSTNLANRWLRVRVTDLATGRAKVNVNLPLRWVELGLKIGARQQPEIAGIDFSEVVEQIQAGANGKLVEVEDLEDGERVEVSVD